MAATLSLATLWFCLVGNSLAAIYETFSDVPSRNFDFIVIGAGNAGSVVANRLSANPAYQVLVLEGGVSNKDALILEVPFYSPRPVNTIYDWNFTTINQPSLNNRSIHYTRGHVLGGSSSVNYMVYTRGAKENWDRYANITGDQGWSWNALLPYFKKNEIFVPPADHHNTSGQYNPAVHGFSGVNAVSLPGYPRGSDDVVLATTKISGSEYPYNVDMNSGSEIGLGWTQSTINGSVRSSAATSYLAPKYVARPNLHILLHAQVSRVLPSSNNKKNLTITTVEFSDGVGGPIHNVTAKRELILSAGSFGTPQILLNSGIGPASELSALGIHSVIDNPSVGKNLSDHAFVQLSFQVNMNNTFDDANRNTALADTQLKQWQQTGTGPLVAPVFSQIGWFRLPKNDPIFKKFPDPTAGTAPHYEFLIANGLLALPLPATGNFLSIIVATVAPYSRGSVTINSTNPFTKPIIDVNYYSSEFDLYLTRQALRSGTHFVSTPAWKKYNVTVVQPGSINATSATDAELDQFIRANTQTVYHASGTAGMSSAHASYGVVGPDLLLKGAKGLSIADASVLPFVPTAHTQAPAYVIGERASDLILKRAL